MRPEDKEHSAQFVREHQWYQYATFLVEKFIYIGAIHDVDMSVAETILRKCTELLESQKVRAGHPRDYERVSLLARSMTIVAALYELYCLTDKEFTLDSLTDIEPYLICTEEIALCAFQMMSTQYVRPKESEVVRAMCDHTNGLSRLYKMDENGEVDACYIRLNATGRSEWDKMKNLARKLATLCNVGENNILIVLGSLLRRSVRSPAYTSPSQMVDPERLGIDTNKPRENIPCLEFEENRAFVATHAWQMVRNRTDIIAETIASTQHAASREETFILGKPMADYPQLLDCTQRRPTRQPIVYTNMLAMDDVTATLLGGYGQMSDARNPEAGVVVHNDDLEASAFAERQRRLGYDAWPIRERYHVRTVADPKQYPEAYTGCLRSFLSRRAETRKRARASDADTEEQGTQRQRL